MSMQAVNQAQFPIGNESFTIPIGTQASIVSYPFSFIPHELPTKARLVGDEEIPH
ncbi:hypothetical protein [Bacillus pseudomycoides]|uniref:hypothetical protein n=1 Tax=Bacillus pseudomycoides TaxID=64104 RepID=UPI0020D23818|nr:hypothetical protein [Bacillus pseudomycoides]